MRSTFAGPASSTGKYKATTDPGKSAPSSAAGSPSDFYSKSNELNQDISKGAQLKHVQTTDKSVPKVEPGTSVKKVDRQPFLQEVQSDHDLQHVDAVADRSGPHIEADVTVKKVDRAGFLSEVEEAAREKGTAE